MDTDFADMQLSYKALERLLSTLALARQGDFSARMEAEGDGMEREVSDSLNELLANLAGCASEQERVANAVAQGELRTRVANEKAPGVFGQLARSINAILNVFAKHTAEVRRTTKAIQAGDFTRIIPLGPDVVHRGGELQRVAEDVNAMMAYVERVTAEVTRVFAEIGLDGRLNSQCHMSDSSGSWAMLIGSVNAASASLSEQVQDLNATAHSFAQGNFAARAALTSRGDLQALKLDLNAVADSVSTFCAELRRAALSVANEGQLGIELQHPNPRGEWQTTLDACNRQFGMYSQALRAIAESVGRIERAELAAVENPLPGELGATLERLAATAAREVRTQEVLKELTRGNFDAVSGVEGAHRAALVSIAERLKHDALNAARVAILEACQRHLRPEAFASAALSALAKSTGAAVGAYHIGQADGSLRRLASFGWNAPENAEAVTPAGTGLIGRVALDRTPLQIDDLDEQRVRIRTSMIEIIPKSVLVSPIELDGGLIAVVELGFIRSNTDLARELVSFVASDLARGTLATSVPLSGDRARAAEEELVITNTRLERLTQELHARDRAVRDLQQELQALRGPATVGAADAHGSR